MRATKICFDCEEKGIVEAWEFDNGAILVEDPNNGDYFFGSADEFQPNGAASVASYKRTKEHREFSWEIIKETLFKALANKQRTKKANKQRTKK